jgi:hypothetical protein
MAETMNEATGILRVVFGWRNLIDRTPDSEQARRADLVIRIRTAIAHHPSASQTLGALWPDGVATFAEVGEHTHHELDRIADIVGMVEAEYGVPF